MKVRAFDRLRVEEWGERVEMIYEEEKAGNQRQAYVDIRSNNNISRGKYQISWFCYE